MAKVYGRRLVILAASYASLPLLGVLAYSTAHIHVGALAVIPILFISYYVRPYGALIAAFVTGVGLGLVDQGSPVNRSLIDFPPLMDALILSVALCTVVVVANRLREAAAANELLHGRLVKARRDADHDALTGIANRSYFMRKLEEAISRCSTGSGHVAVLFCDLDGFKKINDTKGHSAGDQVLRLVADRLHNAVRVIDTVSRIGGDEFGVLVEGVHDGEEALRVASKIEAAFIDPFHLHGERYTVGITVGVSLYPDDGTLGEVLLHIADARMYRSKDGKRAGGVPGGGAKAAN